jgi:hypothetical protein
MTDDTNNTPDAPTPAPAPVPTVTVTATDTRPAPYVVPSTREEALKAIEAGKADRELYKLLVEKKDPGVHAYWRGFHKVAYPAPPPRTPEDYGEQEAARHH